jgi:hypothetical protein
VRVKYSGDLAVAVPDVPVDWTPGMEVDVDDATGAYLLRNVHFSEVFATPGERVSVDVPATGRRTSKPTSSTEE